MLTAESLLPLDEILVGGKWRRGSGPPLVAFDPATGSQISQTASATEADVDEAVAAGVAAAEDPEWAALLPHERARYLHKIAALIERDSERLAQLQTLNTGKSIRETRALVA